LFHFEGNHELAEYTGEEVYQHDDRTRDAQSASQEAGYGEEG
jgi:hypothetical protein